MDGLDRELEVYEELSLPLLSWDDDSQTGSTTFVFLRHDLMGMMADLAGVAYPFFLNTFETVVAGALIMILDLLRSLKSLHALPYASL